MKMSEAAEFLRCQFGTLSRGMHFKYFPFAFTEQGVAMLSSVLNSKQAIEVNIQVMRAFVRVRQTLPTRAASDHAQKLKAFEEKYGPQVQLAFKTIRGAWLSVFKIRLPQFEFQNRKNGFRVKKSSLINR